MSEPVTLYEASGDCRHLPAAHVLRDALAECEAEPPRYAIVVLGYVEQGGLSLATYSSGVDVVSAAGLLELAKAEIVGGD
jgi:hypothetical protein